VVTSVATQSQPGLRHDDAIYHDQTGKIEHGRITNSPGSGLNGAGRSTEDATRDPDDGGGY
jgi:hypothetical protein